MELAMGHEPYMLIAAFNINFAQIGPFSEMVKSYCKLCYDGCVNNAVVIKINL